MTNENKLKIWIKEKVEESEQKDFADIMTEVQDKYEQKVYETKIKSKHKGLFKVLTEDCSSLSLDNSGDRLALVLTMVKAGFLEDVAK